MSCCLLVSHFLLMRQLSVIREDVHQTTNDLTFSKALIYSFHFFPFFTLLSVLRTFIYDPLVEWQRTKGRELLAETSKTGEVTNEEVRCPVDGIWQTERVKPGNDCVFWLTFRQPDRKSSWLRGEDDFRSFVLGDFLHHIFFYRV